MMIETLGPPGADREGAGRPGRPRGAVGADVAKALVGLLVLAGVFAAAVAAARFGFGLVAALFDGVDPRRAIAAAVAAVFLMALARTLAAAPRRARKEDAANRLRERRAELYTRLVEGRAALLREAGTAHDPGRAQRIVNDLRVLEPQLALHGSANVIKRYAALRDQGARPGADAETLLGQLALEMRKDLLPPSLGPSVQALTGLLRVGDRR